MGPAFLLAAKRIEKNEVFLLNNRVANYSWLSMMQFAAVALAFGLLLNVSPLFSYLMLVLLIGGGTRKGSEYSFVLLVMFISFGIMNNSFFTKNMHFYLVTRGGIFVLAVMMTVRAGVQRLSNVLSPFKFLILYILYMMAISIQGFNPVISEMKAVLFMAFFLALSQTTTVMVGEGMNIRVIRDIMLVVCMFFVFGSIAVIPFPQIGQNMLLMLRDYYGPDYDFSLLGDDGLFNGVTWHSQTLGPLLAMLNAFVFSDYLCGIKKRNTLYLALLVSIPYLVYRTSSRTAFLAYVVSFVATLVFYSKDRTTSLSRRQSALMLGGAIGFLLLFFSIVTPVGNRALIAFLRKGDQLGTSSLLESVTSSRMSLVTKGWENFKKKPMIGNGFQVSEDMAVFRNESGLALSAPVEKGVLPIMILEEGGVFGAVIFLAFVFATYRTYLRLGFSCFLSTFTVFLTLNSGEAVFFSSTGAGGILWMVCFCALLVDIHRIRCAEGEANRARMHFAGDRVVPPANRGKGALAQPVNGMWR